MKELYQFARERYAVIGVDTDAAISKLKEIPVSLHCRQGDAGRTENLSVWRSVE